MNDLISRKALIAEYERVHVGPPGGARKLMVDAPTVDAVEVVRCKDCQFYLNRGKNCWCDIFDSITPEMHFCSYGERK